MKKIALYAAAAMIVIALSGCGASVDGGGTAKSADVKATSGPTQTSTPIAAPIEMEASPEIDPATPWGEAGFESADAWFLASMDAVWTGERPSDAQLLGAATLACDQIASGADRATITVVSGDGADVIGNNEKVIDYAVITLCS